MLVERQVRHHALQARILLAHLPELPYLGRAQAAILFLPEVKRRFGDARLPTHIHDGRAGLRQAQGIGDLLFRVPRLLHRFSFPRGGTSEATLLYFSTVSNFGDNVTREGRSDVKKRFSEAQIIGFLRESEAGLPVKDLCRRHGFSEASYYLWRNKFGGMTVSDAKRLKELIAENTRLKKLLAESVLENEVTRDALRKKW